MKKLYVAGDIIEAQLLNSLLKEQGISSLIKNEGLQSGVGELPFVEMWPEVWIIEPKDWFSATCVLKSLKPPDTFEDWICAHCSLTNPGTFETCWSCRAHRMLE
ncbi:DUF2007 domain-containing protein [Litorivicinus sp.]|nr:DUF2007 domain-containing protein [Litorivicinus sp.]